MIAGDRFVDELPSGMSSRGRSPSAGASGSICARSSEIASRA